MIEVNPTSIEVAFPQMLVAMVGIPRTLITTPTDTDTSGMRKVTDTESTDAEEGKSLGPSENVKQSLENPLRHLRITQDPH